MAPETYIVKDNGTFPNSPLPIVVYRQAIELPYFFAAKKMEELLAGNGWTNNWTQGIYTYHHYHSITHEALGIVKGKTNLLLGGENGLWLTVAAGDIIIIPAGVAHKNLGKEDDITCVGGYPEGREFDIHCGLPGERPQTDRNIAQVPIPDTDPLLGKGMGIVEIWKEKTER
jgi:uncharacterized protein YjlB